MSYYLRCVQFITAWLLRFKLRPIFRASFGRFADPNRDHLGPNHLGTLVQISCNMFCSGWKRQDIVKVSMVQFIVDDVFKRAKGIVIDDKPKCIQSFWRKDDFRNIIVPMQPATGMPFWKSIKDMARTELKLFRYCIHEKRWGLWVCAGLVLIEFENYCRFNCLMDSWNNSACFQLGRVWPFISI